MAESSWFDDPGHVDFDDEQIASAEIKENAENGDALDRLGMMYALGRVLAKDAARAASLFRRSANLASASGAFHLAIALQEGFGLRKDEAAAFAWMRSAASQNHPGALLGLAQAYERGAGCEKNPLLANRFYEQAAQNGHKQAVSILIERSIEQPAAANYWLQKARQLRMNVGLRAAARARLVQKGDDELAIDWLEQAALNSDIAAMAELAVVFAGGYGGPKKLAAAIFWAHAAATRGRWIAHDWLELLRLQASGQDLAEAAEAAAQSDLAAGAAFLKRIDALGSDPEVRAQARADTDP